MLSDKQGPVEGLEGATHSVCNIQWCIRALFSSGLSILPLLLWALDEHIKKRFALFLWEKGEYVILPSY